jgi:hypothetical protein
MRSSAGPRSTSTTLWRSGTTTFSLAVATSGRSESRLTRAGCRKSSRRPSSRTRCQSRSAYTPATSCTTPVLRSITRWRYPARHPAARDMVEERRRRADRPDGDPTTRHDRYRSLYRPARLRGARPQASRARSQARVDDWPTGLSRRLAGRAGTPLPRGRADRAHSSVPRPAVSALDLAGSDGEIACSGGCAPVWQPGRGPRRPSTRSSSTDCGCSRSTTSTRRTSGTFTTSRRRHGSRRRHMRWRAGFVPANMSWRSTARSSGRRAARTDRAVREDPARTAAAWARRQVVLHVAPLDRRPARRLRCARGDRGPAAAAPPRREPARAHLTQASTAGAGGVWATDAPFVA